MGFYERIDARGVRETGRPVSFVPKGALTHHPRSGRWYCLRQPCALRGGCGSCGSLMDNATALGRCCHCPRSYRKHTRFYVCEQGYKLYPTLRQLPEKNISLMFFAVMGIASSATPIFFLRKRNKNKSERTVRTNGNLPFGSEGGQPWKRPIRCRCFRISELLQNFE